MRRSVRIALGSAVAGISCLGATGIATSLAAKTDAPEASFLKSQIPVGTDNAGRTWNLGGFSALAPIGATGKEFWSLTDRGPNDDADRALGDGSGAYCATKPSGKVIFLPGFNPEIDKLGLSKGAINVQDRIPLHDGAHPASGKPNLTFDENTFTQTDPATKTCAPLASTGGVIDPFGVDTEGIAPDPRDGSFWLSDEYRPSLIHVASDGQILSRIVPQNEVVDATLTLNTASQYASSVSAAGGSFSVQPVFPGIVNAFRKNRGFEGLALSPDGQTLYTLLQSPMDYRTAWGSSRVTSAQRDAARSGPVIRVFKLDISDPAAPVLDAAWIYLLSRGYGSGGAVPDKISDVQYLGPDQLLVEERDDDRPTGITNFYRADFTNATNLLTPGPAKTEADNTVAPTLEMEPSLPASITPAATSLLVDFDQLLAGAGFVNSKIEGAATLGARGANPGLFVGVNDNDFDLDHTVGLAPTAIPEQVDVFALP